MAINIPERDRDQFAKILALQPAVLEGLGDALARAKPHLRRSELVAEIADRVAIPSADLPDVVRVMALLSLLRSERGVSSEDFVDEVEKGAVKSGDPRISDGEQWARVKPFMARILSLDGTLGVTAKAALLAGRQVAHIHEASILTDARPIFAVDAGAGPLAYVVGHTLRIEMHHDGDEGDQPIYVGVQVPDLKDLRRVIDRALDKDASLRSSLQKTGVPVLSWGGDA